MNSVTAIKSSKIDTHSIPSDLFIGGKWIKPSSGKRIDVFNPSTEERLATIADATVEDGISAVDAAAVGQKLRRASAPKFCSRLTT